MSAFNSAVEGKVGFRREPYYVADKHSMSLEHFYIPAHYQDTLGGLLIPFGAISDRVEKLAYDITQDYNGQTIHLICVLKGNCILRLYRTNCCALSYVGVFAFYITSGYVRWLNVLRRLVQCHEEVPQL